ncbi:MAG: hypothetical protein Q8930_01250 [Bacillota bacterium]|nr:hypothetical protein [Bacillota bacterium]
MNKFKDDSNNNTLFGNESLQTNSNKSEDIKGNLYILPIMLLVFGFVISCFETLIIFKQKSDVTTLGYALFYAAVVAIINILIIVIIILLSNRVFRKKALLVVLSAIYLMFSISTTAVAFGSYVNDNNMNNAAVEKLTSMCNAVANGEDISAEDFVKSEYGSMTPLLNLTKDYFIKNKKLQIDMNNAIASLDYEHILDANTLSSSENINNAKKRISDSLKVWDRCETELNDNVMNFNSSLSAMKLPPTFKAEFMDAFKASQDKHSDNMSIFFKLERDISTKLNSIMDFMLSISGNYKVQDGKISFYSVADLNKYNEYIADFQSLVQKESDVKEEVTDSLQTQN